jgi:hypothetical protein
MYVHCTLLHPIVKYRKPGLANHRGIKPLFKKIIDSYYPRDRNSTEGEYGEGSKYCGDSGHGAFRSVILQ